MAVTILRMTIFTITQHLSVLMPLTATEGNALFEQLQNQGSAFVASRKGRGGEGSLEII